MYEIEMQIMSPAFQECWQEAGKHLEKQVQDNIRFWLRAHPHPPFLEHLSFRLGNQLFFVRVEDVDGKIKGPGILRGLYAVAKGNEGHACLMPMKKIFGRKQNWIPVERGWGLIDATTRKTIDPFALVDDEKIEMSLWELQDMAVQVVREYLQNNGYQLMCWQSNPDVNPAIWFEGDSQGPEWIVVRVTRSPLEMATRPENWQEITRECAHMSEIGHFASVALVSAEQDEFDYDPGIPLWRGYGMHIYFSGLE